MALVYHPCSNRMKSLQYKYCFYEMLVESVAPSSKLRQLIAERYFKRILVESSFDHTGIWTDCDWSVVLNDKRLTNCNTSLSPVCRGVAFSKMSVPSSRRFFSFSAPPPAPTLFAQFLPHALAILKLNTHISCLAITCLKETETTTMQAMCLLRTTTGWF